MSDKKNHSRLLLSSLITHHSLKITRRSERGTRRRHRVAEANFGAAQSGDARFDLFGRERGVGLVEDPVNVLRVAALALLFRHAVAYEPEVEVDRHERLRVEAFGVIRELS